MAMTKKEQAYVAELEKTLGELNAFHFTSDVRPDLPPPAWTSQQPLTKGFLFTDYISVANARVEPACSSSIYHSFGNDDKTTTQGPRELYSTRVLALRGLRRSLEKQFSRKLADIDAEIAKETAGRSGA